MTTRKIRISLIIIIVLSILGPVLWLYEIVDIKTWNSLSWLSGQLYSPFVAILFSVLAFMTPFFVNRLLTGKKAIVSVIIFYSVNLICFEIGKYLCYEMYSKLWWLSGSSTDFILMIIEALFLFIFMGFTYWLTTYIFIKKTKKINILFTTLLLLLTIPLSMLTIYFITGFGNGTDWVDAVKMGYPIFWTTLLLGITSLITAKQPDLGKTKINE